MPPCQPFRIGDALGLLPLADGLHLLFQLLRCKVSLSALDAMLSNSKYLGGVIGLEDYFAVQVEKGKRSNIDEDTTRERPPSTL